MMKKMLSPHDLVLSPKWRFKKSMTGAGLAVDPRTFLWEAAWHLHGIQGDLLALAAGGEFVLIDGCRRLDFARRHGINSLSVQVFDEAMGMEAMHAILLNEFDLIVASSARKAAFVAMLGRNGIPDDAVIKDFLPLIGLEAHRAHLSRCQKIGALGTDILEFCHEKGFASSQCFHLTRHPPDLLAMVFGWRDRLALSASLFEQVLDLLRDLMLARDVACGRLISELKLETLLAQPELTPQQRGKALLFELRRLRQPLLTKINGRLKELLQGMELPQEVHLAWDPTLEREELTLTISLAKISAFAAICGKLSSPHVVAALDGMVTILKES